MSMTKLEFTTEGLLVPNNGISVDLATLEYYFVGQFPASTTRRALFENYLKYQSQLQSEVFPWFEQWVDGSFVTLKENPKDIDLVTLLDFGVYETRTAKLEKFYSFSLEKQGIDSYFVPVFPSDHKNHEDTSIELAKWHERFTLNRDGEKKGYLKLVFGKTVEL